MRRLLPPLPVYLISIAITIAAVLIRIALMPWLGLRMPLVTLFPAIAAVSLFWGMRPARREG